MARFFMTGTNIFGGRAVIRGQDAEHIRVLRMRPGEDVVICDGKGTDYRCRLVSSGPEEAEAEVLEVVPCRGEPRVEVTVYAGLPKGERADFLVQKCIEAGASGIVFFNCERCVARPDGRSMEKKLERFSRIAEAAAQQSGRGKIPTVEYEHSYVEMLNRAIKAEAKLFMYETGEGRSPLKQAIGRLHRSRSEDGARLRPDPLLHGRAHPPLRDRARSGRQRHNVRRGGTVSVIFA